MMVTDTEAAIGLARTNRPKMMDRMPKMSHLTQTFMRVSSIRFTFLIQEAVRFA